MKIQIIGFSGSGKSTLAKILGKHYQIPCLHLDNVKFYGDWQERSRDEQNTIVRQFMKDHEGWIIDGTYNKVAPERFTQTDLTIYLKYSRLYCYRMCKRRYLENKNNRRDSFPCIEKFDWEFKRWLLFTGRTKKRQKMMKKLLSQTQGQQLIFKNRKELHQWLHSLGVTIEGDMKC